MSIDQIQSVSAYDENREKGTNQEELVNYDGTQVPNKRESIRAEKRAKAAATSQLTSSDAHVEQQAPELSQKEKEAQDLRLLAEVEEMEITEFINLANLSLAKANALQERIDVAKKLVLDENDEDLNIQLSPKDTKLLQNLIGKDTIDKDAAKCLNRLANYNEFNDNYASDGDLDSVKTAIEDTYSDENIDQYFPDFGLDLLLVIAYLIPKFVTINVFGYVCKVHTMIFTPIDSAIEQIFYVTGIIGGIVKKLASVLKIKLPTINENLPKFSLVTPVQIQLTISANCINESIYWQTGAIIKNKFLVEMMKGAGTCAAAIAAYLPGTPPAALSDLASKIQALTFDPVCTDAKFDLEAEAMAMFYGLNRSFAPSSDTDNNNVGPKRCDEDYKPTPTERALARNLLQSGMEKEQNTYASSIDTSQSRNAAHILTSYSMLDKMSTDTSTYVVHGNGIVEKLLTEKGNTFVDRVDASILGFFTAMNGALQMVDEGVTKIIALEFLPHQARVWVCCIVRFFYIMLPRMRFELTGKIQGFAFTTEDIDKLTLDEEFIEDTRVWLKIMKALIDAIMSSTSLGVTGLMSIADVFNNSLKMAIAESTSIVMTSLYYKLKKTLFKAFDELKKVPDLQFALESCEPLSWFMNGLQCSLENFISKIQNILAQMWSESANAMRDIDLIISIHSSNITADIIKGILDVMLQWDEALINFCSLRKTASEAEKTQLIQRLTDSLKTPVVDISAKADEAKLKLLEKSANIYSTKTNLGPVPASEQNGVVNGTDQHTNNGNPFFLGAKNALLVSYGEIPPSDDISPQDRGRVTTDTIKVLPQNEAWNPKLAVKSCGDEFKAILSDRISFIDEMHKSIAKDNQTVSKTQVSRDVEKDPLFAISADEVEADNQQKADTMLADLNK